MWAAFRNNYKLAEFLVENGADISLESLEGYNAMDLAVIRMSYEVARLLRKQGLSPKGLDFYEGKTWRKYDLDLFFQCLEEDREYVDYDMFYEKIRRQEEEWKNSDLVVDTRETWKKFINRQINFEDPPLCPRAELPDEK